MVFPPARTANRHAVNSKHLDLRSTIYTFYIIIIIMNTASLRTGHDVKRLLFGASHTGILVLYIETDVEQFMSYLFFFFFSILLPPNTPLPF